MDPALYMLLAGRAGWQSWSSGLFGCFNDWSTCCYGFWCLPCLYGSHANKVQGGGCVRPCCLYAWCGIFAASFAGYNRAVMRETHRLHELPYSDRCVHCFCSPCAVCQEVRELKAIAAEDDNITSYILMNQQLRAPATQLMR